MKKKKAENLSTGGLPPELQTPTPDRFYFTTYEALRRDGPEENLKKAEAWVFQLTGERDKKGGPAALAEIHQQYDSRAQREGSFCQTFFIFDSVTGQPVAMQSIYDGTNSTGQTIGPYFGNAWAEKDGYSGGLVVDYRYRSEYTKEHGLPNYKLGRKMMTHVDNHEVEYASELGRPLKILSCTAVGPIKHIYGENENIRCLGEVRVDEWNVTEELFMKTVLPKTKLGFVPSSTRKGGFDPAR